MEKTQINLQVGEEQKEDWERYVDESRRFSSLSDLIRSAVETEINEDQSQPATESPGLAKDVQDLKDEIHEVRQDVAWLRDQQQGEVDISDLAQAIFDELKPLPDLSPASDADVDRTEYAAITGIEEYGPQTANALAERVDSSPKRVEDALDHLQDQFLPVTEVTTNNRVHYFKEE